MNSTLITKALKWAGLWSILIFFVALLTLIFSFLGAIFCAALAGMMMGASKHSRWQVFPLAAVFPAVLWMVLRTSKAELLAPQVHMLMVVCFATYWVTYGIGLALVCYERKGREAGGAQPGEKPGLSKQPHLESAGEMTGAACAAGPAGAAATEWAGALTLRELQGKWWHQVAAQPTQQQKELMEIEDNRLTLSAIGADGRVRRMLRGELKIETSQALQALVISASYAEWPADLSVII